MDAESTPTATDAELEEPRIELLGELPPALAAGLVAAQKHAHAVVKAAENEAHSYAYTRMEDLIEGGKDALNASGLALIPGDLDQRRFEVGEKRTTNYDLVRRWMIVHESGAVLHLRIFWPLYLQSGKRARDKAVSAADTTMLGYLYRDLLGIPRLAQDQMDARDDRGSTEPGQAGSEKPAPEPKPSPPAKPKPAAEKPAAKPKPKPAAEKPKGKPAAKPKPPAKGKPKGKGKPAAKPKGKPAAKPKGKVNEAKPAEVAEEEAEERAAIQEEGETPAVEAKPETGTGDGGTTKRGKTDQGQTYGDKAEEVAAAQQAELTDDELDAEVTKALAMGITPSTTNDALIVDLPSDPTAADLEGAGWPEEVADELEGFGETEPVARKSLNAITRQAAELLGMSFKEAKPLILPAFIDVGVDVKKKGVPNGYQLRLWCLAIAAIASADTEEAEAPA